MEFKSIDTEEKVREIIVLLEKSKEKFKQGEIRDFLIKENDRSIFIGVCLWNKLNTRKLIAEIHWYKTTKKLAKCIVSNKNIILNNTSCYNSVINCINQA